MTRGEILSITEEIVDSLWDDRDWQISQKADNPVKTYQEIVQERISLKSSAKIDDLPKEQQDWLRNS